MIATDYTTTITVDESAQEVFNAVNNVRAWWSKEIEGNTNTLHDEWTYHYQDVHRCKMKITELVPNKKVVWEVLSNHFSFTKDKSEWIGNKMIFEITEEAGKTQLRFTQLGLTPEDECFDICQNSWNTYIGKSLYKLITTGKGEPNGKNKPTTEDEKALSADFTTTFFVDQKPKAVFDAINNVRDWWQGEIKGDTDKTGDEFTYQMKDVHFSKQKITEMITNKKVVWTVIDSKLSFISDRSEWTGTKMIFEITEINNKTQVRFTHQGLVRAFECYGDCSNAWEKLIQQSLHSLITSGKGVNVFD